MHKKKHTSPMHGPSMTVDRQSRRLHATCTFRRRPLAGLPTRLVRCFLLPIMWNIYIWLGWTLMFMLCFVMTISHWVPPGLGSNPPTVGRKETNQECISFFYSKLMFVDMTRWMLGKFFVVAMSQSSCYSVTRGKIKKKGVSLCNWSVYLSSPQNLWDIMCKETTHGG